MACQRQLLLLSTSTIHGSEYLDYAKAEIDSFFKRNNVSKILFIPFALRNHDEYASKAKFALKAWGYDVDSIHEAKNHLEAVNKAQAFFIGGGNTFQLLKSLYDNSLVGAIRKRVLHETRETRINQYHEIPGMPPVIGLREGSILHVDGTKLKLLGNKSARLFMPGERPKEYESGADLSFLINENCSD
ncbi:hypothetical protein J437_LFUL013204 [Ladona fulva]|uniref:Uncharacterized protein n=1 Tax=Ladona fulva TaxID=123851 RepID=A0A8K0P528_LADFU|nr:hypothetical protein J437_LFUL013204 [Ladona fulva]